MATVESLLMPAAFIGVKYGLLYAACRRYQRRERVGVVSQILIYPVKSCPGVSVDSCVLTEKGIIKGRLVDRSFLIVKPDGVFVTQRTHPQLARIHIEATNSGIILSAPDMNDLHLPFDPKPDATLVAVRVWQSTTTAVDCGDEAGCWAEAFLQLPGARIVQAHPTLTSRPSQPMAHLKTHKKKPQDCVNFQDCVPINVLSTASIDDLNKHLENSVDVRNFRPNLLMSNVGKPYDEDEWSYMFIGKTKTRRMWLNERCKLTTVDPNQGAFRSDGQPLQLLTKLRTLDGHRTPCLGINAGTDVGGVIKVGDEVFAARGRVP